MTGVQTCALPISFDPFKLIGGVAKDHPDEKDLAAAVEFYQNLITNGARDE